MSRDFHELYLISAEPQLLDNFWNLGEPGSNRKDQQAVQRVRERIHELNYAAISLYRMAIYLGHAQRVSQELQYGELDLAGPKRTQIIKLLAGVRAEINGPSGAGLADDLQDLIGESVWRQDGAVISYYEFRERLLAEKGWEQFTDLFRFFVHFHRKINSEVKNSGVALGSLQKALWELIGSSQLRDLSEEKDLIA